MNNTMIPILPELKSAMKQVTKQYQSDFDLDTKVIQKAAKEAKADGKPQTFLWFCRESGTYIARESNAYLKESPMYISYHYYADQQRREAKGIKAYVVTVTGLDGSKHPVFVDDGFGKPVPASDVIQNRDGEFSSRCSTSKELFDFNVEVAQNR